MTKENKEEKGEGWRAYKYVCDKEGKEVVDDLMRTKRIDFRRNPRLGPDSQLAYPSDQQVWYCNETLWTIASTATTLEQERSVAGGDHPAAAGFAAVFDTLQSRSVAPPGMPDLHDPATEVAKDDHDENAHEAVSEKDIETARSNLSKVHGEWDRKCRDMKTILVMSGQCEVTASTPLRASFKKKLEDAGKIDKRLMDFETNLRLKKTCSSADIKSIKSDCIDLNAAGLSLTKVSIVSKNSTECAKEA